METMYFQRQGVSHVLRIQHGDIYAECIPGKTGYHVEVIQTLPAKSGLNTYNIILTTNPANGLPQTMDDVAALIIDSIADKLQRKVDILPQVAAYMYYSNRDKELWPHIAFDVDPAQEPWKEHMQRDSDNKGVIQC